MRGVLIALLLCHVSVAQSITVVFMGILPGGAPEFEKRFTTLLRERITVLSGVKIADYDDTEYLKKKTDFNDAPSLSRAFIEKLMLVSSEKTLVVWGDITGVSIKPKRRWLFGAEAVGTLTLSLTLYSLDFREYAYIGDVSCKASIPKPPVFFGNVEKETQITASDRGIIIGTLQEEASRKTTDIINGIVKSQMVKTGQLRPEEVTAKKVPSVSDLFDIPTVEAPDVGEGAKEEEKEIETELEERKQEAEEPVETGVEEPAEAETETETETEKETETEEKAPEPSKESEE